MAGPIIHFNKASFAFKDRTALEEITLEIMAGEFIGVIGPNGSGKTTLLRALLGLIAPGSGQVQIFDCSCEKLRCHHRAQIGYLPQKEMIDANFPLTVFEAVLMGRYGAIGLLRRPSREDQDMARQAIDEVGLSDYVGSPLGQLSGGQQQRVFIARALAQRPKVLLLDEPTTGIDIPTQKSILEVIKKLHVTRNLTILLVTHDINMIAPYVDRLALLKTRLYAAGPPKEVLTREILQQVYGKEVVAADKEYLIIGDYHHA